MTAWLNFFLMLPKLFDAMKAAFDSYKKMQEEKFYADSVEAFAKLERAQNDDEIKDAAVAIRDLYKRV